MKRSEMIEKIEFALSQIAYAESIDRKKFESEYIANRVLEVCEEAGMLPPAINNLVPWESIELEWESENEEE